MRLRLLLIACFLTILSPGLRAQLAVYGSFSATKINVPAYDNWLYGGTFGGYLSSSHLALINLGVDVRGSFANGGGTSFDSGSVGPRLGINTHILPVQPYIEATAGVGHASFVAGPSETKFEYQFLGGFDMTVLPRIDWRVAEFSYGGLTGLNTFSFHPKSISTGIVLRLPRIWAAIP